ncbi:MAG: acyl-CoA dehydratase activase-related protein [Firmicutes bacterium]|nr:acyl-CoA dehydratase activase-related protein [Bacillota bacterium]
MPHKVGIPRALVYYNYFPWWRGFFEALEAEVVVSGETTKQTLDHGVRLAVDEACLPVKVFFGHVLELSRQKVDFIFVPRIVSVERKAFICPKFMGLPDMVRNAIPDLPSLIDVTVDLRHRPKRRLWKAARQVGRQLGASPFRVIRAVFGAQKRQRVFQDLLVKQLTPPEALAAMEGKSRPEGSGKALSGKAAENRDNWLPQEYPGAKRLKVAVLGHSYNIYDQLASQNVIRRLREMGVQVVTADMLPAPLIRAGNQKLAKPLFWTFGKKIAGAAFHWLGNGGVDGIVHLVSFGCGPDSMVGELVQREAWRGKTTPFMLLTLDEHTGESGIVTRLEAFVDMLRHRMSLKEKGHPGEQGNPGGEDKPLQKGGV